MDNETKHTAGPWSAQATYEASAGFAINGADGRSVAAITPVSKRDGGEKRANALLLAAAPSLLALLKRTTAELREFDVDEDRSLIAEVDELLASLAAP